MSAHCQLPAAGCRLRGPADGALPADLPRRSAPARRHRAGDRRRRVAQARAARRGRDCALPRREDALVPREPREGLLPLLRLSRRRRRDQVRGAAREGRLPRSRPHAGGPVRPDGARGARDASRAAPPRRSARRCSRCTRWQPRGSVRSSNPPQAPGCASSSPRATSARRPSRTLGIGFAPPAREALKAHLIERGLRHAAAAAGGPRRPARQRAKSSTGSATG